MEKNYNVKVTRNVHGEIKNVEKGVDKQALQGSGKKFNNQISSGKKSIKFGKNRKKVMVEPKPKRPGKKAREKSKLEKKEQEEALVRLERKYDSVKFGEIVHAPPHLKSRPRGSDISTSARPGSKDLLLKTMLEKTKESSDRTQITSFAKLKAEERRIAVVNAYREMKAKQRANMI